jgi:hypothetical protein
MKERETVTVGTPTKYEEKRPRIKYDPTGVLAAIAEVMCARGLNKDAVVTWLNEHEQEAWDTYVGPMLDHIETEIKDSSRLTTLKAKVKATGEEIEVQDYGPKWMPRFWDRSRGYTEAELEIVQV